MTTLVFEGGEPRHLLARLLDAPNLAQVVQGLDPKVLHQLVRHCGLEECGEIVALATTQQLTQIFDDDLWHSDVPGQEERFDADRFGLWLEVLADAGESVAAGKIVAMDFDFVTAAISRQVLVLDSQALMMCELSDDIDFGDYDPLQEELKVRSLEEKEGFEIGGYTVIAKRSESHDALLVLLRSLDHQHHAFFGRLMERCCRISTEWIVDNGGLHEVLSSDEQVMEDVAGHREERREQQGYISASQAAAFLKLARQGVGFEAGSMASATEDRASNDPSTLPDIGGSNFPRIRAQLRFVQEHDGAAYERCTGELAYLANVLVAGCTFQSRRFRPDEAADAVLATCNLALENWPLPVPPNLLMHQDLVTVFQTGWRILYEEVCLLVATGLIEALSDLQSDDAFIQGQITEMWRRMTKQVAAGTPWRERDNLTVIAILDLPSWAMLVNLVDECPVVPRGACTPSEKPQLRVATEFEFISENRQIRWARGFTESLARNLC